MAGASQVLTLPTTVATLTGQVTDDGLPTPPGAVTTTWSVVSANAAAVTFGDVHARSTTATFAAGGVYVLRLTASDGARLRQRRRAGHGDQAPVDGAGVDRYLILPPLGAASTTLAGTASDPDGLPSPPGGLTTTWSVVSSPDQATVGFNDVHSLTPTATFSAGGVYVLRLTATDGAAGVSDDVQVTVDHPPVVDAGGDATLPQVGQQYTLQGSVTDDGLPTAPGYVPPVTAAWSLFSGPAPVTFGDPTDPTTTVAFTATGVYTLRLTATEGAVTTSSDVVITVVGGPLTPVGVAFAAAQYTPFAGVVARFTDSDPAATADQFAATINWGDNTSSLRRGQRRRRRRLRRRGRSRGPAPHLRRHRPVHRERPGRRRRRRQHHRRQHRRRRQTRR